MSGQSRRPALPGPLTPLLSGHPRHTRVTHSCCHSSGPAASQSSTHLSPRKSQPISLFALVWDQSLHLTLLDLLLEQHMSGLLLNLEMSAPCWRRPVLSVPSPPGQLFSSF